MAHVAKIKAPAVFPMLDHYERTAELERGYRRENIDPERMRLNYNLRPSDVRREVRTAVAQHEQAAGKALRKDANVLMDWVVTLPKDCPADRARDFFESVTSFIEGRYGKGNVVGAYVHMDEATPHIHVPVLPVRDGKLQASKVVNRADLKSFHGDLAKHVDRDLGFHVSVELDEKQQGEKQLSALSQSEYVAAKERLECLRREVAEKELEPAQETVAESVRTLWTARSDGSREEALAGEVEGIRERISGLERQNLEAGERAGELERAMPALRERCERARERFEVVEQRVTAAIGRLREVPNIVSEWAQGIARKLGKRIYDPNSLDYQMRQARAASRGLAAERSWQSRNQNRGWSR